MSTLAHRIVVAMRARNMSQHKLEVTAEVSDGYVTRLIKPRGKEQRPTEKMLRALSKALRVNYDWLAAGVGPSGLPEEPDLEATAEGIQDRAWLAWHSLPRARGRPPGREKLEIDHELPRDLLTQLFDGSRTYVRDDVLPRLAAALATTPQYLKRGTGAPPTPTGPVPPRRDRHAHRSTSALALLQPQMLGTVSEVTDVPAVTPMTPFDVAVEQMRDDLTPKDIGAARKIAGDTDSVEVAKATLQQVQRTRWREEQQRLLAEARERKRPTPPKPSGERKRKAGGAA